MTSVEKERYLSIAENPSDSILGEVAENITRKRRPKFGTVIKQNEKSLVIEAGNKYYYFWLVAEKGEVIFNAKEQVELPNMIGAHYMEIKGHTYYLQKTHTKCRNTLGE